MEFEVSNKRSNIPPCICVEYWELWERLKFWIKGSILATFADNIWSRLKSPTIRVLCCVDSLLIVEIKSSMKVLRGPVIQYTTTNKSLLFYVQYNWQYLKNIRNINYFNNIYLTDLKIQSQAMLCILMDAFPTNQDLSICFEGLSLILVSVKKKRLE